MSVIEELSSHTLAPLSLETVPVVPPTLPLEIAEVKELNEDLLVLNIQSGNVIAAQLEICFYSDGRIADIESYRALGTQDTEQAKQAYELVVSHLAGSGFIDKIEYWGGPEGPDVFAMQAAAKTPANWQKRIEVQDAIAAWRPLELTDENVAYAMGLLAQGKSAGLILTSNS